MGLLCYFCRFKKKIDTSTVTLKPIEFNDEKVSLSKTENIQPLNEYVVIENSSLM